MSEYKYKIGQKVRVRTDLKALTEQYYMLSGPIAYKNCDFATDLMVDDWAGVCDDRKI